MPDVSYPRLHKAVRWACKLHKNQDRDGEGALPYITHVSEVVSNLRYVGGVTDEEMLCVAALHDVVEQSEVPFDKIEGRFGKRVTALVMELTRKEPGPKQTKGKTPDQIWKLRSSMLLAEIGKMSKDAQTVKLADRLSNIRNARQTKLGAKLDRTLKQTEEILHIIPRPVNPDLWDAIKAEVRDANAEHRTVIVEMPEPTEEHANSQSKRKPVRMANLKK